MRLCRDISELIRTQLTWEEMWKGSDLGLIACWESGREKASKDLVAMQAALRGELIILPWRGGVEYVVKVKKYGTYNYLAMWQGLRGESLDIDTCNHVTLVCTRTNVPVIFNNESF